MTLIIFDLDGTLIDSRADLGDAMNEVRKAHSLPPLPLEVTTSFVGQGERNAIRRLMPESITGDEFEQACLEMRKFYQARQTVKTTLYPGVKETLAELSKMCILCVATNKPQASASAILSKLGVADMFKQIIGGGVCKKLKPDPEIAYLAAELCGETLEGSWMVGDHFTDLATAANAGMYSCFCNYGFGNPKQCRADAVIQEFSQLITVISQTK